MCMPSCSSHSPNSETPMSPTPIASVTFAPQPAFQPRPERLLAAAGLTGHEHALDARPREVDAALLCDLDEMGRVGGREHGGFGTQALDRQQQPLRVARAEGDVAEPDAVEGGERGAGRERPGVVRRHDPLAGRDAGRRIAPRRRRHPVVEITGRQRHVARRAGRAARRVDADELGRVRAEMGSDRVVGRARRPQLVLLGQRQLRDAREPTRLLRRGQAELLPVERRSVEQIRKLLAVARVVERELLVPRRAPRRQRSYSTASSAAFAMTRPIGCRRSSARCASRPAVRARMGTAFTSADE